MRIEEVASTAKAARVAAHTHIRGLGLGPDGRALPAAAGFVGQAPAREACGIVVDLIRAKKMAGRALLLAGAPGTGKTALALGIAQELGARVPFCPLVASEVFSAEVKKTAVLMEHFRRAIGLRIRETKEVYEGEVTELTPEEVVVPSAVGGGIGASGVGASGSAHPPSYGKAVSHVILGLKTARGSKQLRLDPAIHSALLREKVAPGDVVYLEAASGAVRRVGRCAAHAAAYDLGGETYVPLPTGDVHKRREVVQDVTLHDLDAANARPGGAGGAGAGARDLAAALAAASGGRPRKTEITDKLRAEVNAAVDRHIEAGVAELVPGVLFVDEAHMLDADCFAWLNRALESPLAPVVVLATNRGVCPVRGTGTGADDAVRSPHGIPVDLLDRLVIVRTLPYTPEEAAQVLALRAGVEGVTLADPAALAALGAIAASASLRHAAALLSPAAVLAAAAGRGEGGVTAADVEAARSLFMDARASAAVLAAAGPGEYVG